MATVKADLSLKLQNAAVRLRLQHKLQMYQLTDRKTRELINANELVALREKLSDAKAALRVKKTFVPAARYFDRSRL